MTPSTLRDLAAACTSDEREAALSTFVLAARADRAVSPAEGEAFRRAREALGVDEAGAARIARMARRRRLRVRIPSRPEGRRIVFAAAKESAAVEGVRPIERAQLVRLGLAIGLSPAEVEQSIADLPVAESSPDDRSLEALLASLRLPPMTRPERVRAAVGASAVVALTSGLYAGQLLVAPDAPAVEWTNPPPPWFFLLVLLFAALATGVHGLLVAIGMVGSLREIEARATPGPRWHLGCLWLIASVWYGAPLLVAASFSHGATLLGTALHVAASSRGRRFVVLVEHGSTAVALTGYVEGISFLPPGQRVAFAVPLLLIQLACLAGIEWILRAITPRDATSG